MQCKRISVGYLVAPDGVNINTDHIHLADDGQTILSHKVNGEHSYRYSDARKDLSRLWEEVTGEPNKFSGGWRP